MYMSHPLVDSLAHHHMTLFEEIKTRHIYKLKSSIHYFSSKYHYNES